MFFKLIENTLILRCEVRLLTLSKFECTSVSRHQYLEADVHFYDFQNLFRNLSHISSLKLWEKKTSIGTVRLLFGKTCANLTAGQVKRPRALFTSQYLAVWSGSVNVLVTRPKGWIPKGRSPLFQYPNNIVDFKLWFWIGPLPSGLQSRQVFSDKPLPYCFQSLSDLRPTFRLQRRFSLNTGWHIRECSTNKEMIWG